MENLNDVKIMFERDYLKRNIFKKFIEYIRFPKYKNFSSNLKINFNFPITFLVGPNGTGKSSLLQALYGAPKDYSVSKFWFNTVLDPIDNIEDQENCFIYSYKTAKTKIEVEVIKKRTHRDKKLDYWEPSRPVIKYGMIGVPNNANREEATKTRWNLLEKNVYYLDFRYELSAYDKYFYFGSQPNTLTMRSKQDLIRKYSKHLKKAYDENKTTKHRKREAKKPIKLTQKELEVISSILNREYIEASIVEHDLYDKMQGFSIRYKTKHNLYSEAYAGSGETAIVKLVHDIYNAVEFSLILLDEPETSLHPGAQYKLIEFILEQIKIKKFQEVISTHSPDLILHMPKEAIKVFYTNPETNKTEIIENVFPKESFSYIGHILTDKKVLIVEDILAKMILEKVLLKIGGQDLFEIKFFPGGESRIKQEFMVVYSKEESKKHFIIFDGDQKTDKVDISTLTDQDRNVEKLKEKILSIVNEKVEFNTDGNKKDGGREDQAIELMLKYIKYHNESVYYLPKDIPEQIIWSDEILERADIPINMKTLIKKEKKYKNKFKIFAKNMFGCDTTEYTNKAYEYFLIRWLAFENDDFNQIKVVLNKIKSL